MAFPQVIDADTMSGTVTTNSTSWTLTYPTNLVSGDLILAFVGHDGASGTSSGATWPAGFITSFGNSGNAAGLLFAKKLSDGTETGSFTLTLPASEQGGWRVFRITGWEGTIGTEFSNLAASGAVVRGTAATGASNVPNPPSLDPVNWATEDTLWIAATGLDTSRTISVFPLPDRNTADVSGGSNGATLGICMDELAQSSLDPSTFTISASDEWAANTIAIRPSSAPPPPSDVFPAYVGGGYYG